MKQIEKGTRTLRSCDLYRGWRRGLFPASTMFCHSFDSRASSGVYTNFRTFQSVFLPLGIKGNVENYFGGIHLQIQSKWKKHVPDQTQMQHDQKLVITRECILSHLPLASLTFGWFAFYRSTSCVDTNPNIILPKPSFKIKHSQARKHNGVI